MATDWPVRECRVQENWKCAGMENYQSPEAQRDEVMGHNDVTRR
jgi:hypothetical protein